MCALAAFVIFMSVSHPPFRRTMALGLRTAQASDAEREPVGAELAALRATGGKAGAISALLLVTAAVAMAVGRSR